MSLQMQYCHVSAAIAYLLLWIVFASPFIVIPSQHMSFCYTLFNRCTMSNLSSSASTLDKPSKQLKSHQLLLSPVFRQSYAENSFIWNNSVIIYSLSRWRWPMFLEAFHTGSMLNALCPVAFPWMQRTLINVALVHGVGHFAAISLASRLHYNVTKLIPWPI